jgi:hypothetical protein
LWGFVKRSPLIGRGDSERAFSNAKISFEVKTSSKVSKGTKMGCTLDLTFSNQSNPSSRISQHSFFDVYILFLIILTPAWGGYKDPISRVAYIIQEGIE